MKLTNLTLLALSAVGCTEHRGHGLVGTQSIQVTLVSPTDPGSVETDHRLPETMRTVVVDLAAKDADNEIDTAFNGRLRVYTQFLGTLTPPLDQTPPITIAMTNGVAMNQTIALPPKVLGPTTLWIDDGRARAPTTCRAGSRARRRPCGSAIRTSRTSRRRATSGGSTRSR